MSEVDQVGEQIEPDFAASEPSTVDDAHRQYAHLRQKCPVAYTTDLGGFWALLAYADVRDVASKPEMFTTTVQNVVPRVAFTGRRAPLHLDPPEHTPYRRALNSLLGERQVARLGPAIRQRSRELLTAMLAKGGGDICAEFSAIVPLQTFGDWMQLPKSELGHLRELAMAFNAAVKLSDQDAMRETSLALYDVARSIVADRKSRPRDITIDPASALLNATYEGEPLPEEMVVGCVRQVLVVGLIAPMVMIGSISLHLCRDPELQEKLRAEPSLIPDAIEEFLRLYTPYRGFARTAREPVEIGARRIPKDRPIALVYSSANRDESVFPDPHKFVLNRHNIASHMAFGRGPHHCPGAALARLELRIMLEELLEATRSMRLVGEPIFTDFPELGVLSATLELEPAI